MTARAPRKTRRDDRAASVLLRRFRRTGNPKLREELVLLHEDLVRFLAWKFAFRGEPLDDLVQVASIGLLQAIDRFDPARGVQFITYATTTIVGEIKRYFRDKSWSVHVPRRLRELNNTLMRAAERFAASEGRSPTLDELAKAVGVSFEDAAEALEVGLAYNPVSLDAEVTGVGEEDGVMLRDSVGDIDPALVHMEDRHTIEGALRLLPAREQKVLRMRYYEERSQADIARELGISQMHVSRIQRDALKRLRELIEA